MKVASVQCIRARFNQNGRQQKAVLCARLGALGNVGLIVLLSYKDLEYKSFSSFSLFVLLAYKKIDFIYVNYLN